MKIIIEKTKPAAPAPSDGVFEAAKSWALHNFWKKVDFAIASRGAQDTKRPVALNANGYLDSSLYGTLGGAWTALAYTNAGGTTWADFGGGHQIGQYKKFGDLVFVRGLAGRTAGAGTTIATLPTGYRPATYVQLFSSLSNSGAARVDVDTFGQIILQSGGATWVTLTGFVFSVV